MLKIKQRINTNPLIIIQIYKARLIKNNDGLEYIIVLVRALVIIGSSIVIGSSVITGSSEKMIISSNRLISGNRIDHQ